MQKCNFPNCNYIAEIITNHHAMEVHGITLKELKLKYGRIIYESPNLNSKIQAWIRDQSPALSTNSYHELTVKRHF